MAPWCVRAHPALLLLVLLATAAPAALAEHDRTGTRPIELEPREGPPALAWVVLGAGLGAAGALLLARARRR